MCVFVCVKELGNILVELFRVYEGMGLYSKKNLKATFYVFSLCIMIWCLIHKYYYQFHVFSSFFNCPACHPSADEIKIYVVDTIMERRIKNTSSNWLQFSQHLFRLWPYTNRLKTMGICVNIYWCVNMIISIWCFQYVFYMEINFISILMSQRLNFKRSRSAVIGSICSKVIRKIIRYMVLISYIT